MAQIAISKVLPLSLYLTIDGVKYGFTPFKIKPQELADMLAPKLREWRKSGEPEAQKLVLAFIRRYAKQVFGPVAESVLADTQSNVSHSFVDSVSELSNWWSSAFGRAVVAAIKQRYSEVVGEENEKNELELQTLSGFVESVARSNRAGRLLLTETGNSLTKSDNNLLARYNQAVVALNKNNLFSSVVGVDTERRLNYIYIFLYEDADVADVVNFVKDLKSNCPASSIISTPANTPDGIPKFWFIIVANDGLPEIRLPRAISNDAVEYNQVAAGDRDQQADAFSGTIEIEQQ